MRETDVVVAGGGPAGLQFAREIAERSDHSVVVLEANESLRGNDKSTGGTFGRVVDGYDVPPDVVMAETDSILLEAPDASGRVPVDGYVLDFPAFLSFLGEAVEAAGGEVRTGAKVTGPVTSDGRVTGVEYRARGETRRLAADLVVDATGPRAVLAGELGMFDAESGTLAVGKEYEVAGDHDVSGMLFRFDHDVAPGGYAWTFPAGDETFKSGVCWLVGAHERETPAGEDRPIDEYVDEWIAGDGRWERERVRAVHAGRAVVNDSRNRRAVDGLVAVGDAVSSINPLFGEGIQSGMESAEMAADVALEALAAGDTSRDRLARYERRWNCERGVHWRRQYAMSELFYEFDADQQSRFVRNVDRVDGSRARRLVDYELSPRDYLSLYPFDPGDLRKIPRLLRHLR